MKTTINSQTSPDQSVHQSELQVSGVHEHVASSITEMREKKPVDLTYISRCYSHESRTADGYQGL